MGCRPANSARPPAIIGLSTPFLNAPCHFILLGLMCLIITHVYRPSWSVEWSGVC